MNPLESITVTDDDIDWVEGELNLKFDERRREIIRKLDSFDVQAFPGTGKTTVIIAKLAILARKWPSDRKGICVLSYTNVAKEEIERRLGDKEVGQKLLHYPHFIGTLNSFFNTYAGIPRLHHDGYMVQTIDDDIVEKRRRKRLNYKAETYLDAHHYMGKIESFSYPDFKISPKLNIGECTPTFQSIKKVVEESFDAGNFLYDEVLRAAGKSLAEYSWLPEALQNRFPLVIVDEAQDTNEFSRALIVKAFPKDGKSRLEFFGDANQAIYNSNAGQSSCWNPINPLTIPDSRRFGESISRLSKSLAVNSREFRGVSTEFENRDIRNKIYLFDDDSISNVIPTFAEYVLSTFSQEEFERYRNYGIHVVCRVGNEDDGNTKEGQFPKRISDYWPQYSKENASKSRGDFQFLIDYFRKAKHEELPGKKAELISKGLIRLANINTDKAQKITISGKTCTSALAERAKEPINLRKFVSSITKRDLSTQEKWNILVDDIRRVFNIEFNICISVKVSFLQWKEEKKERQSSNVYEYSSPSASQSLDIQVGTIHSVKGQTHLATLLLESYCRAHDIEKVLGKLCSGKENDKSDPRERAIYVALTRAKALVCMAIPVSTKLSEKQKKSLQDAGWVLENV